VSADQGHRGDAVDSFEPALGVGEAFTRGFELQDSACVDVEDQVADQFDGASLIFSGGDVDGPSSRGLRGLDGGLERGGGFGGGVIFRAEVEDVEEGSGGERVGSDEQTKDESQKDLHGLKAILCGAGTRATLRRWALLLGHSSSRLPDWFRPFSG